MVSKSGRLAISVWAWSDYCIPDDRYRRIDIFFTRCVIFGYRILFLFVVISILKWILVFSTVRDMVATGIHPFHAGRNFRGDRVVGCLNGAVCIRWLRIPIWVSFHCSVLGDLLAGLTHTKHRMSGAQQFTCGVSACSAWLSRCAVGGYQALERVQLIIVAMLLAAVALALVLLET